MSDPTQQELMEAVTALRAEVEKSAPNPEVLAKTNDFLDKQEEINQKNIVAVADAEEKAADFQQRMEALELELVHGGPGIEKNYRDGAEYKALSIMVRKGMDFMEV